MNSTYFAKFEDWRKIADRPVEYVFDGVLDKGSVGLLVGPGGVGKSMLMLELAVSAVLGKTLLPSFKPSGPLRVLVSMAEDSKEMVFRRLRDIEKRFNLNSGDLDEAIVKQRLWLLCGQGKKNTASQIDNIELHAGIRDLVLIDPLSKHGNLKDENSNAEASKAMSSFQRIA
jgi:hypothetical protein